MSNDFFRFKQFTVFQEHCTMKVGTDGVLLGAWADVRRCIDILDVGTGTGLLALMIAQRNMKANIDAIDIDYGCIMQAQQNVIDSPFAHRIYVQQVSFQNFVQKKRRKYDLIVSNPPYFHNSLKSPVLSRNRVRHNDSLSFHEIISLGASHLSECGRISLILPYEFKHQVLQLAATKSLFANRLANVFSLSHKPAKRLLIELGKLEVDFTEEDLIIEVDRHKYSSDFNALTSEFYLSR